MVDEETPETTGETSAVATVGMEETVTEVTEIEGGGGTMTEIASGITVTRGGIMMTGGGTRLAVTETDGGMRGVGRGSGQSMHATRNGGVLLQTSLLFILLFRSSSSAACLSVIYRHCPPIWISASESAAGGANPASSHPSTSTAMIPQHASCSPIFFAHIQSIIPISSTWERNDLGTRSPSILTHGLISRATNSLPVMPWLGNFQHTHACKSSELANTLSASLTFSLMLMLCAQ